MWANPTEITQFGIQKGDLLICEGGEGGRSGIVTTNVDGHIIQNALHRVRPKAQNSNRYLQYVMYVAMASGWLDVLNNKATIAHFTREKLAALQIPLPPLAEQDAIVRYLDFVDQRVRRYVRAKERLIGLLEEEKQAIINQAVTRGLDPSVRMKASRVEWLGEVPEHWEVTRLGRVVRSTNAGEVIDKGWWGRGVETLYTCARQPVQSDFANFPVVKRTTGLDLLLTRNGTPYVHRPVSGAIYSNVVQRINFGAGANREWIALSLEAAARGMKGYGVSIESLNYDMWKVLVVLVPPKDEQAAIVALVDKAARKSNAAIARAKRQIELLEEYRTRLIADVVTGKLDVREAAAGLGEEGEDALGDGDGLG